MFEFLAFATLSFILQFAAPLHGLELEPRVMNGNRSRTSDTPWTVAIVVESTYKLVGTGTILSATWVLTNSHIWLSDTAIIHDKNESVVLYGAAVIEYNDKPKVAIIEDILIHRQFLGDDDTYKFDISVIKTTAPMELKPSFAEAKKLVPKGEVYEHGTLCAITGYGATGDPNADRVSPDRIRTTRVELMNNLDCSKHWIAELLPGMLCAGSDNGALCEGDAGAALVCADGIYAVFSRGMDCVKHRFHVGFYVRVEFVREWIEKATNNEIK